MRAAPAAPGTKRAKKPQPAKRRAVSIKLTPEQSAAQQRANEQARLKRRRIMRIAGMVLGLVIVGAVIFFGVRYMMTKIGDHTAPPNPVADLQPVPCDSTMLSASVNQDGDAAGYPINFGLSMVNDDGEKACYIDTGYDTMKMTITSGGQLIYDSQACEAGPANKRLLLDVGLKANQTFYWNGKVRGPDCSGTLDAQPGTYVARFYNGDGEILERGHVFELEPLQASDAGPADNESPTPEETTLPAESRGIATDEPTATAEPTDVGSPTSDPEATDGGEPADDATTDPFEAEEGSDAGSDLTEP